MSAIFLGVSNEFCVLSQCNFHIDKTYSIIDLIDFINTSETTIFMKYNLFAIYLSAGLIFITL